jgi:mannose-1-phosphate guanylyltransferase/mannose-1-phosphate guanylyltransferase/mannose-6-phosphate isomerase
MIEPVTHRIYPVVLSGGSGTRLWPMSREAYPKQLLPLVSEFSLLQETARRVAVPALFHAPLFVCNEEHRFIVAEQLRQAGIAPSAIVLEPVGRNTAPAVCVAALLLVKDDPNALMLVLPSDHIIANTAAFHDACHIAATAALGEALVTFGMTPDRPETGYGYIRRGTALKNAKGAYRVAEFVEKPDLATAQKFLVGGRHAWNSGMFLFPAALALAELERFEPGLLAACRDAVTGLAKDLDFLRLPREAFAAAPSKSIDYALMEKTDKAAVVPVELGWSDVGSWSALWDIGKKDECGNVVTGDVMLVDARNSYIRSEDRLVAAIGVEDLIVIATDDVVMVLPRERAQDVKGLVEKLRASNRTEPAFHPRIYRPWGYYETVHDGDRFQVKRITVKPGARLSLQMHHHRAEHWIVVNGTARVTCGEKTFLLSENESTYIPMFTKHRLENPGKVPLNLIEVQSGSYLGEDDIVRYDDQYGRT